VLMRAGHMPDAVENAWHTFPASAPVPLADAVRLGQPLFLCSRAEWAERYPHLLPQLEATGHHANAVMPLVVHGRVLGVLGAAFEAPHVFDDEERALAVVVAQQCAQALERARLFAAERDARADAEAANRAKSDFLATMSHELRTPLNAIQGYAELLALGVRGDVNDAQREDLERIQRSQRHLLSLVNDVLNFARIDAGQVRYDITAVPVAEVVADVGTLVAPQLAAKALTFALGGCLAGEAGDVPTVRADREKLAQILLNLLANAIKFTPEGGRISLACDRATHDGRPTVHLRVADSGIGISPAMHGSIFEPFVQVQRGLTRTSGGTGLGLAISRELARAMQGDVVVHSEAGAGATFTLMLPAG
jgi:signal transduction histidine kinase